MKVWATTDRQASVMLFLWMSKTNWGFLMTFTQNRRGRLERERRAESFYSIWTNIICNKVKVSHYTFLKG